MSRKDPYSTQRAHPEIGKFRNVEFVQADLLKTESYPKLDDIDCVVHCVGSITDLVNYKRLLKSPAEMF